MSDYISHGPCGDSIQRDGGTHLGEEPECPCPRSRPLFEHMADFHGLTLTEIELDEIERIVLAMNRPKNSSGSHSAETEL